MNKAILQDQDESSNPFIKEDEKRKLAKEKEKSRALKEKRRLEDVQRAVPKTSKGYLEKQKSANGMRYVDQVIQMHERQAKAENARLIREKRDRELRQKIEDKREKDRLQRLQ